MRTILIFALLFGTITIITAQSIGDQLTAYAQQYQTEKVYFAHDKPFYAPGETIWGKIFLVDGQSHQPYAATPVVYVDWIKPDGTISKTYTLQVKEGSAAIDIATTLRDTTGIWEIRAYTQYQRNFPEEYLFQKEIRLLDQQVGEAASIRDSIEQFTVRIFPEGGHLVADLESTVAFQARNDAGENISVSGLIVDEDGNKIIDFLSLNEGMGMFKFLPEQGKNYTLKARCKGTEREFPLPAALPQGTLLKASSRAEAAIRLSVVTNRAEGLGGGVLVGHVRGQVFLEQALPAADRYTVQLAKTSIPSGVVHFTVFDKDQRPAAERLVFNKHPQASPLIAVETDQAEYEKRAPVTLKINAKALPDSSVADLSLSVYNLDAMDQGMNKLTIENYLLLQSDLRGRINNIQQYFAYNDSKTNTLMDLLLLTHGWRKFAWQDVLDNQPPTLFFGREESLSIAGKITKFEQDRPIVGDVQLHVMDPRYFTSVEMTTAEDGIFFFKGFAFQDTVDIMLQASTFNARQRKKRKEGEMTRTGNRYVDIELIDLSVFPYTPGNAFSSKVYQPQALKRYAFTVTNEIASSDEAGLPWTIDLAEVTVTTGLNKARLREQEIERRYKEKGIFYFGGTPKFRLDDPQFDDFRNGHIYELIAKVIPGANFVRRGGEPTLLLGRLSGATAPIIVLDGQIVPKSVINNINPDDIAVVDVLEGLFSLHYTDDGVVVQLVSKAPSEITRPNPGMKSLRHPGYYQSRTFYSPDYATITPTSAPADFRTTLFWKPDLVVNQEVTQLNFHTGDKSGNYLVWIEGLCSDGTPFTQQSTFRVE